MRLKLKKKLSQIGDVVSKDVLKSFRNLLQGGDGTSTKKLDEDLDILWVSKGGKHWFDSWLHRLQQIFCPQSRDDQ